MVSFVVVVMMLIMVVVAVVMCSRCASSRGPGGASRIVPGVIRWCVNSNNSNFQSYII